MKEPGCLRRNPVVLKRSLTKVKGSKCSFTGKDVGHEITQKKTKSAAPPLRCERCEKQLATNSTNYTNSS